MSTTAVVLRPAGPSAVASTAVVVAPPSQADAFQSFTKPVFDFMNSFVHILPSPIQDALGVAIRHFQSLFVPEQSWLFTLIIVAYIGRKLYQWAQSAHDVPRMPAPIDHALYPQFIVNKQGLWLYTHQWPLQNARAYVFICHAYREHSLRYESIARAFNRCGYAVFSVDHVGHGQSQGERGHIEHFEDYIDDFMLFIEHTRANLKPKPSFILGRGMGATIAIQVNRAYSQIEEARLEVEESRQHSRIHSADETSQSALDVVTAKPAGSALQPLSEDDMFSEDNMSAEWHFHGAILLSPALIPTHNVSALQELLAKVLCDVFPKFGFFTVLDDSQLSRIPAVVEQFKDDPLVVHAPMLARWGSEMLNQMAELRDEMQTVSFPFLVLQGSRDSFVSPMGAEWMITAAQSLDKRIIRYHDAYHDLLHDLNREIVFHDILQWIQQRVDDNTDEYDNEQRDLYNNDQAPMSQNNKQQQQQQKAVDSNVTVRNKLNTK